MASDWPEVTLEEVADEVTVGYVGSMTSEYIDSGIPFLRSKNVDVLNINKDDLRFISDKFHQKISKSRLSPGDVVIVRTGKPGTSAVIPDWLEDANCSDLVIVRCGKELNSRFLSYYLNTVASSHVNAHLVGAVQQHFNVGSAKTMKISLPSIVEQENIVNVLGILDDKIELNRQMNATLEAIAQALFKSWFVDFDPVIDNALAAGNPIPEPLQKRAEARKALGDRRKSLPEAIQKLFPSTFEYDGEFGWIPKEWDKRQIKTLVEDTFDGPHATPKEAEEGPVFLGVKNFTPSSLNLSTIRKISEEDWPKWTKRVVPREQDIVFTYEATLGFFALIPAWLRCCLGRRIALVRPIIENEDAYFLFHSFIAPLFQQYLEAHMN